VQFLDEKCNACNQVFRVRYESFGPQIFRALMSMLTILVRDFVETICLLQDSRVGLSRKIFELRQKLTDLESAYLQSSNVLWYENYNN